MNGGKWVRRGTEAGGFSGKGWSEDLHADTSGRDRGGPGASLGCGKLSWTARETVNCGAVAMGDVGLPRSGGMRRIAVVMIGLLRWGFLGGERGIDGKKKEESLESFGRVCMGWRGAPYYRILGSVDGTACERV